MTTKLDPSQGIAVITDGSSDYRDGTGGWAYVLIDAFDGIRSSSGSHSDTTVNRMELTAVIEGLRTVYACYSPCPVIVYSDSEYVVLGASDKTRKRHKNKDLWRCLDKVEEELGEVKYEWVRGHTGQQYNEMADHLAGEARRKAA